MVRRAQNQTSSANSSESLAPPLRTQLEELKYVFGPLPAVMRVHAGDIIDTTTVDATASS